MNYDKVPELPDVPEKPAHRRAGVWLAAAVALLALGAAGYWQFARPPATPSAEQRQLAGQVATLEARLASLHAQLAALPDDSPPAPRRVLLEEAVARQTELLRLRVPPAAADSVRLSDWQAQLDDTVAREWGQQSRDLETAAEELRRQKQPAAAVEKLQEALRLQREINRGMAARQLKSYGREALLQQQIEELSAVPR